MFRAHACAGLSLCAVGHSVRLLPLVFLLLVAFLLPVSSSSATSSSSLSGVVYVDEDFDQICDVDDEWVLPNIEMWLINHNNAALSQTVNTDEFGYYEFTDLVAGDYSIKQSYVHDDEYFNVVVNKGQFRDAGDDSPVSGDTGSVIDYDPAHNVMPRVASIALPSNVNAVNYNFGQYWLDGFNYLLFAIGDPGDPPYANPPGKASPIPEPGSLLMLLGGSMALATILLRRRRRG